jgi:hypothetical protein
MRRWLPSVIATIKNLTRRRAGSRPRRRARLCLERLEDRLVPVAIVWTNVNTDAGFSLFGNQAALARNLVGQAIIDWENVIVSFNGKNANFPNDQANIKVFIQLGNSQLSSGGFFDGVVNKLPDGSSGFGIILGFDRNQPGTGGWYLSPNPSSNSDFQADPRDPQFAGTRTMNQGGDFLSVALHEIGHILGALTIDPKSPLLTATGTSVPDAAGTLTPLYVFHFPNGVTVPLMEPPWNNGIPTGVGHLFFGTVQTPLAGTVTGRLDVMNQTGQPNERTLISDYDAFILEDALGYRVNVPSQMGWTITNSAPPPAPTPALRTLKLRLPVHFPRLHHSDLGAEGRHQALEC